MDRRKFIGWFSLTWIASSLPYALAACSETDTKQKQSASTPPASSARSDGFRPVGSLAKLNAAKAISLSEKNTSVIIVSNTSQPNSPFAVDSKCTHKGCELEWKDNQDAFVCPCHGAKFGAKGNVLGDPGKIPLKTYEVKTEGDVLLLKIV